MGERGEGGLLIAGFEGRLVHGKERGEWGHARRFPEKKGGLGKKMTCGPGVPERERELREGLGWFGLLLG
jgi:hypothetical protein